MIQFAFWTLRSMINKLITWLLDNWVSIYTDFFGIQMNLLAAYSHISIEIASLRRTDCISPVHHCVRCICRWQEIAMPC